MRAMPEIDTRLRPSVSFAPAEPRVDERGPRHDGPAGRVGVPMGPGRPAIVAPMHGAGGLLGQVSDYPVQIEKVQAPPLRDETLARDRLLDWLHVKIHRRAVLVLAEAGYGKTTLLADFTRRTRVRVSWYRLDRGDRDWLGFIAHLVAAFRIHQPDFAPITQSMIREASAANPSRDALLDTFIRELGGLPAEPASLVLDDFHLVDDSQESRSVVRELLARAPERLTFVLISRTTPSLPFARLRALGEVAELRTSDLRFAPDETERLFRETYALNLEPAVVAELSRRTEGWVASLQLVRAAIRDRNQSEIRAFVRSLSGAEGDLYDYLAEEVVGELSGDLQQFLMRTSLLEVIEPTLGSVAGGVLPDETRRAIAEGELLGLFSRTGPNARDHVRAHPLVRDFLQARLHRSVGAEAVIDIHRAVAVAAEAIDWRIAGHHYLAAGDLDDARRVLASAIDTILATGAYAAAEELVTALPVTDHPDPNVLVVLSRLAQQRGQLDVGRDLALDAHHADPNSAAAALNLQSALMNAGDIDGSLRVAAMVEDRRDWQSASSIARATRLLLETSQRGPLIDAMTALEIVVSEFESLGDTHYLGIAYLSLGYLHYARAEAKESLRCADESIAHLSATSAGNELVSARLLRGIALAHAGRLDEARTEVALAAEKATPSQGLEVALESAAIEVLYGDPRRGESILLPHDRLIDPDRDVGEQAAVVLALALLGQGRVAQAGEIIAHLRYGQSRSTVAMDAMRQYARAVHAVLSGAPDAKSRAIAARDAAASQGAGLWAKAASVLCAADSTSEFGQLVEILATTEPSVLSLAADVIGARWDSITPIGHSELRKEAARRPERWRLVLRHVLETASLSGRLVAAGLLDEIGTAEDVPQLRRIAREFKGAGGPRELGRGLARRLALPVWVNDLGRVEIRVCDRPVDGSLVRRKVLALLCFLVSRSNMSATREEVLEALWPDLEPGTALNSLNQTVYFLRRVFEPGFQEETSPAYLGQDGELVWLDGGLVGSQSRICRALIRSLPRAADPDQALHLAKLYTGRFAIDFMYEDWAADYRDALHTAYLRVIEAAIRSDLDTGHYDRGIQIAQLATEVEPQADEIQVSLLRLFRMAGSMAAAAEQYAHYAQAQRELGVEPEPFDQL